MSLLGSIVISVKDAIPKGKAKKEQHIKGSSNKKEIYRNDGSKVIWYKCSRTTDDK